MSPVRPPSSIGAILLAGGRATRVDGAAKHLFDVGGRTLLARAVAAATAAGSVRIVVAGEPVELDVAPPHPTIEWVREDPPFGGPAAGIIVALGAWEDDPDWMLVLACDLPGVEDAVATLLHDLGLHRADIDGICLADGSSRPQWLTGVYRTASLRRGAAALSGDGRGASVRALLGDLAIATSRAVDPSIAADVDTWEDLDDARRRFTTRESPTTSIPDEKEPA